jgi:hypothetical protein
MKAPGEYVRWINGNIGFNPRSQGHSNALCSYVDADLRAAIPMLARRLDGGALVFGLNLDVPAGGGPRSRNVDMGYYAKQPPSAVVVTVENKTIMTAHGRARKNRLGDLLAYCMHLHTHHPRAVAGFTIVINAAARYKNPDEFSEVAKHKAVLKPRELEATIELFRKVPLRVDVSDPGDIPEALAIIVVDYDGQNPARLLEGPPAPQPDEPNYYGAFVDAMSQRFVERFGQE